jgi:thiol-disulfide isomerase/thioredoxin
MAWVLNQLNPGLTYLTSVEELISFEQSRKKSAIGYFPTADPDLLDVFRWLARHVYDISFAYTSEPDIGSSLNLDGHAIRISVNNETHVITRQLDDENELYRTMSFLLFPRPILVTEFSIRDILSSPFPILLMFVNNTDVTVDQRTLDAVRDSGILLGLVDCDSSKNPIVDRLSKFLGGPSDCPSLWIIEDPTRPDSFKSYKSIPSIESLEILEFVSSYSQKLLNRFVKSDPPEPVSYHEARVVVGSEWESFVKTEKAKLILFYASWCSYCLDAIEIVDGLARSGAIPNLVISKMDKARNDSPGLPIEEYPTLVFLLPRTLSGLERFQGPISRETVLVWAQTLMRTVPVRSQETTKRPLHDEL